MNTLYNTYIVFVGSIIVNTVKDDIVKDDKIFENNFGNINNSCIFALLKVIKIMVKL